MFEIVVSEVDIASKDSRFLGPARRRSEPPGSVLSLGGPDTGDTGFRWRQDLLDPLPTVQQRVVELRQVGLTTQEIAESLGIFTSTAKAAQFEAFRHLQSMAYGGDTGAGGPAGGLAATAAPAADDLDRMDQLLEGSIASGSVSPAFASVSRIAAAMAAYVDGLPGPRQAFDVNLRETIAGIRPSLDIFRTVADIDDMMQRQRKRSPYLNALRVLVVEEREIVRRGLVSLVSSSRGLDLVDGVPGAGEAFVLAEEDKPDVAVIGTTMSDPSWQAFVSTFRLRQPEVAVVLVTPEEREDELVAAIRMGIPAYCATDVSGHRLVEIIERAAIGQYVINDHLRAKPHLAAGVLEFFATMEAASGSLAGTVVPLAKDDEVILRLIRDGLPLAEFARMVGGTEERAEEYVTGVLRARAYGDGPQGTYAAQRRGRPLFKGNDAPPVPEPPMRSHSWSAPLTLGRLFMTGAARRAVSRAEWAWHEAPVAGALLRCVIDEPGGAAGRVVRDRASSYLRTS